MANRRIHDLEDTATTLDSGAYIAVDSDSYTAAKKFAADSLQTAVDIGGLTPTDGNFIVGNGSAWVAESGATVRTSLGLGTMATEATTSYLAATGATTGATSSAQTFTNGVTSSGNVIINNNASFQIGNGSQYLDITRSNTTGIITFTANQASFGRFSFSVAARSNAVHIDATGNVILGGTLASKGSSYTLQNLGLAYFYTSTMPASSVSTIATFAGYAAGTPSDGAGIAFNFQLESSTTEDVASGRIASSWYAATHASRQADLTFYATDYTAEREGLRIRANGSAAAIGFLGATPAARQSHIADVSSGTDTAYETAINSILSVLETFGLVATS